MCSLAQLQAADQQLANQATESKEEEHIVAELRSSLAAMLLISASVQNKQDDVEQLANVKRMWGMHLMHTVNLGLREHIAQVRMCSKSMP